MATLSDPPAPTGFAARLARWHDAVTRAGFALACLLLALIAVSFCYEIVARYLFNAPTEWASPLVSFALVTSIFLAMPQLTMQGSHISINVLIENAGPRNAARLLALMRLLALSACLMATWFCLDETLNQFNNDIWTSPPFVLPKWSVSMFVPYGFLSSALYFLRQLVTGAPLPSGSGAAA